MYDPLNMIKNMNENYLSKSLLVKEQQLGNVSVIINSPSSISDISINIIREEDKYDYGLSLNIIKCICGMGILGITYTFKQSGYFYFIIMLLLSGLTGYNAVNISKFIIELKKMEKYKDNHLTYFNISEEVYGKKIKVFTQIIWSLEIVSCCILVVNLSLTFLNQLFNLTDNIYLLCSIILFFYSITFIRNYNQIKFLSIIGLTAIFLLFCFIAYNLIHDLIFIGLPKNEYKPLNYKNIPESITITLFSFGGHIVFPEIFSSIKNPQKLQKNIIYTWTTFTIFVICFIFVSFFLFGDSIHENIINNLDQSYWFKKIILILLLFNIICTFPLLFTPLNLRIVLNIKSLEMNKYLKIFLYRYFIRFCLIVIICIIGSYWKSYINIMSAFIVITRIVSVD